MTKELRACSSCKACCFVLAIDSKPGYSTRLDTEEDISKPAGVACRYLTEKACSIYEVRPKVCRAFNCDWKEKRSGYAPGDIPQHSGCIGVRGNQMFFLKEK
ncbi:MAG: YkgJ family cysteine cluster protein [Oligoflexales bacterium]|nr:YkgJ family cysteine cluster protein [Oligoflexales bacterium]